MTVPPGGRQTLNDVRRAFALLPRRSRRAWLGLLPLALLGAAVEAAGAAAVFLLLRALVAPVEAARLPLLSHALGQFGIIDPRAIIVSLVLAVILLYLVRLGVLSSVSWAQGAVTQRSIVDMTACVLDCYLRAPLDRLADLDSAALIHRVQRGVVEVVTLGFISVVHMASEILVACALVLLLAIAAPVATLFAAGTSAVLLLVSSRVSRTVFRRWGEQSQDLNTRFLNDLQQSVGAPREVRLFQTAPFFVSRARKLRVALARLEHRQAVASDGLRLSIETGFVLVLLVVVAAVSCWRVSEASVAVLGLFAYTGFRLVPSTNRITLNLNNLRFAVAPIRDICGDLAYLEPAARAAEEGLPTAFEEAIEAKDLSYHYSADSPLVLAGINLRIPKGISLGVVGATGAGKTTLVDLLLGLRTPTTGQVLVDGRDLQAVLSWWQGEIGYVAQNFVVFDGTLRENIAFGVPPEAVDDDRVREAVRVAQLELVVATLSQGLDTVIGENGARLSGGERQRVAIARALYRRPSVLVFDEATASLDPCTAGEFAAALAAIHGTRTIVVIAHRPETIRQCDRVVMLQQGRVVADGPFDELVAGNPTFRRFVAGVSGHQALAPASPDAPRPETPPRRTGSRP